MAKRALEALRRDFVERFGREPGPDDSLLAAPEATAPTPLSGDAFDAMLNQRARNVSMGCVRVSWPI